MSRWHMDDLDRERQELIADIHRAFSTVTREGGVSWSEADVIDDYGTLEEQRAARESDTDTAWTELADDPAWAFGSGSQFCFLDPIGFRYYLPVVMIRSLRSGIDEGCIASRLTLSAPGNGGRRLELARLTLLDESQHRCVVRFLRYMIALQETLGYHTDAEPWREALESYWLTSPGGAPRK